MQHCSKAAFLILTSYFVHMIYAKLLATRVLNSKEVIHNWFVITGLLFLKTCEELMTKNMGSQHQLLTVLTEIWAFKHRIDLPVIYHSPLPQTQRFLVLFDAVLHSSVASRQAPSGPPTSGDREPQEDISRFLMYHHKRRLRREDSDRERISCST